MLRGVEWAGEAVGAYYVGGEGFDIGEGAMLTAFEVAVAHEGEVGAVDADNPVDDVAGAVDVSEDDMADSERGGVGERLEDEAVAAADDEWEHADALHGQRDGEVLLEQGYDMLDSQFHH